MLTLGWLLRLAMLHHPEAELGWIVGESRSTLHRYMRLSDGLRPESVHPIGVEDRIRSSRHWHVTHPMHTTHPDVSDVLIHSGLRHGHLVVLRRPLHVVHPRSGGARLVVRLVLRRKTLRRSLNLLVGLLLWLLVLLGSGSGGRGRGGRRVTLGVRVAALVHYRVFAIPIFERDQYIHVQVREELGGGTRVWGR